MSHSSRTQHHTLGISLMLMSVLLLVTNFLIVRTLGHLGLDAWTLVSIRFTIGFAVVSILYRRKFKPTHLFTNPRLIARGIIGAITTVAFSGSRLPVGSSANSTAG